MIKLKRLKGLFLKGVDILKISRFLYKKTRFTGRWAGRANDVETLISLNPKRIAKRFLRKKAWKKGNGILRNITKVLR